MRSADENASELLSFGRSTRADLTLAESYARATPPHRVGNEDRGDEDNRLYLEEDQGDEADNGPGAWSGIWRLHEAEQAIRARYEALAAPYLVQLRRNPGVRPPGLVELERKCADEIAALVRTYSDKADKDWARRNETRRINEAHERQRGRAALQALASDLPCGLRRYQPTEYTSRATGDIWRW